jgi:hypothetical protein
MAGLGWPQPQEEAGVVKRVCYSVLNEPSGDVYRGLIEISLEFCSSLLLVVRSSIRLESHAHAVLSRLEPFLLHQGEESEWPGTQLLDHFATVYQFKLDDQTAGIMVSAADSLYAWRQPELPEDPCFMSHDGEAWLTTISHERDAYLMLKPDEASHLQSRIQGLNLSAPTDVNGR